MRKINEGRISIGFVLFMLMLFNPGIIWCSPFQAYKNEKSNKIETDITSQIRYNDNIDFGKIKVRDFIGEVNPTIEYTNTSEKKLIAVNAFWSMRKYREKSEWDTIDQTYKIKASKLLTSAVEASIGAGIKMDTTREVDLVSEGLLRKKSDRQKLYGFSQFTYLFDEISKINVSGEFYNNIYSEPEIVDYSTLILENAYDRLTANMKTVFHLKPGYAVYNFSTKNQSNIYQLMSGFQHSFTEKISVTGIGGMSYTDSEIDTNKTGFVGFFEFKKKENSDSIS